MEPFRRSVLSETDQESAEVLFRRYAAGDAEGVGLREYAPGGQSGLTDRVGLFAGLEEPDSHDPWKSLSMRPDLGNREILVFWKISCLGSVSSRSEFFASAGFGAPFRWRKTGFFLEQSGKIILILKIHSGRYFFDRQSLVLQ